MFQNHSPSSKAVSLAVPAELEPPEELQLKSFPGSSGELSGSPAALSTLILPSDCEGQTPVPGECFAWSRLCTRYKSLERDEDHLGGVNFDLRY